MIKAPLQPIAIEALLNPRVYPHPVDQLELIETHISWILLTGPYAYKVKKPVQLGFVEASTLQRRLSFCFEELRLNRRLAPDLYLGVVEIIGPPEQPKILAVEHQNLQVLNDGVLEVAVKMRQFPASSLLSEQLRHGEVTSTPVHRLAEELAAFHLTVAKANPDGDLGSAQAVIAPVQKNLMVLRELNLPAQQQSILADHQTWINGELQRLRPRFRQRLQHRAIRECHGDLHAGNIHLTKAGRLEVFDAIDFNQALRWIDPISELAFLVMDLQVHQRDDLAMELLNHWLEQTGDYWGMDLWRWYSAYRALVRAKVTGLRLQQIRAQHDANPLSREDHHQLEKALETYLRRAQQLQQDPSPALILMHGLSGSGKSFLSERLCRRLPAIRLRSDLERQRPFGHAPLQQQLGSSFSPINPDHPLPRFSGDKYAAEVSDWLFAEWLPRLAGRCLAGGLTTIVDATLLRRRERDLFCNLARGQRLPVAIVACECSESTAAQRIMARTRRGNDPSEADLTIRQQQKTWLEPLGADEQQVTVRVSETTAIGSCLKQLEQVLNR
ncbi:MAG: AAA family ATPase [Prochlorococcus sp.]